MPLSKEDIRKTYYEGESHGISWKIKKVLSSPKEFFEAMRGEGTKGAFIYYALFSLVYFVLFFLLTPGLLAAMTLLSLFLGSFGAAFGVVFILVVWLLMLLFLFVIAGYFHIFVRLLGGKQGYSNTYKASVYSSTPSLLLGWIPFIGLVFSLWSLYLYIKGLSILHNMSMGRAFTATLIATLLPLVLLFLFVFARSA